MKRWKDGELSRTFDEKWLKNRVDDDEKWLKNRVDDLPPRFHREVRERLGDS
jgi:hypothetical protein